MDQEHWNRLEHNLAACRGEVSALREEIERLRAEHAELVETVARLREALGG
jgi:predicted  nucleic acid-binding Zn-ribbon protein